MKVQKTIAALVSAENLEIEQEIKELTEVLKKFEDILWEELKEFGK